MERSHKMEEIFSDLISDLLFLNSCFNFFPHMFSPGGILRIPKTAEAIVESRTPQLTRIQVLCDGDKLTGPSPRPSERATEVTRHPL